jgi:hypothetical protein
MKIRTMMTKLLLGMTLSIPLLARAQQVTCTPSVAPTICKQFDVNFGSASMWSAVNFTKTVEIVIVDPTQFKTERAKLDAQIEAAVKNRKSVGDINRAGGREAGKGVFDHQILECPNSSMVTRIIISTETSNSETPIGKLSDQLFFYVIGYDQGLLQGHANLVP